MAYGGPARQELEKAVVQIWEHSSLPVAVICDKPVAPENNDRFHQIIIPEQDRGGRLAKMSIDTLSPFDEMIYMDVDSRVRGSLDVGFDALHAGWDMVLTSSGRQGDDLLGNCDGKDRKMTIDTLRTSNLLGLQCGVMWIRKSPKLSSLFSAWREEWSKFKSKDQAAFLRALWRVPVSIWLLGRPFNGGNVIEHHFGRAKR